MRRSLMLMLGCLMAIAGCTECRNSASQARALPGCILGYDSGGIAAIRLADGAKTYLVHNDESHWWTLPRWDQRRSELLCVNLTQQAIFAKPAGGGLREVWSAPEGTEIADIAVSTDVLLVLVDRWGQTIREIIALNRNTGEQRKLATAHFDIGQPLQVTAEGNVLAACISCDGGGRSGTVTQIDLADGSTHDLMTLPSGAAFFRLSPDGETIFMVTDDGRFQVDRLTSSALRQVRPDGLPGRTQAGKPFCFVDEELVLVWREQSAMIPLGTYEVDCETGKSSLVCRDMLWSMTYVPDFPFNGAGK